MPVSKVGWRGWLRGGEVRGLQTRVETKGEERREQKRAWPYWCKPQRVVGCSKARILSYPVIPFEKKIVLLSHAMDKIVASYLVSAEQAEGVRSTRSQKRSGSKQVKGQRWRGSGSERSARPVAVA